MDIDPGISNDYLPMDPKRILQKLHTALNTRDVVNLLLCFQPDYESFDPVHPEREYMGLSRLEDEWTDFFADVPRFQADLLRSAIDGETVWTEWHWHDGEGEGASLNQLGVIIFGVEDGLIAWTRRYMEPVRTSGAGMDWDAGEMSGPVL